LVAPPLKEMLATLSINNIFEGEIRENINMVFGN